MNLARNSESVRDSAPKVGLTSNMSLKIKHWNRIEMVRTLARDHKRRQHHELQTVASLTVFLAGVRLNAKPNHSFMPLDEEYFDKVISGLATREDLKAFASSEDLKAYATKEDL